jgi:hypothetical protein
MFYFWNTLQLLAAAVVVVVVVQAAKLTCLYHKTCIINRMSPM